MKNITLLLILICALAGCATAPPVVTQETRTARVQRILDTATRINDATGRLMKLSGPTVVSLYCAAQPPNCPAATAAYSLALAAQKEYAAVLADMNAANAAPDGAKLATLAGTFQKHFAALTQLTGGKADSAALTEFQTKLAELQAISE